jgi:hypothetical protein
MCGMMKMFSNKNLELLSKTIIPKVSLRKRLQDYIKEYGDVFECHNFNKLQLLCKYCSKMVQCERKSQIAQHVDTSLHKECVQRAKEHNGGKKQKLMEKVVEGMSEAEQQRKKYMSDLCACSKYMSERSTVCNAIVTAHNR